MYIAVKSIYICKARSTTYAFSSHPPRQLPATSTRNLQLKPTWPNKPEHFA